MEDIEELFPASSEALFSIVFNIVGDSECFDMDALYSKTIDHINDLENQIDELLWIALHFIIPSQEEIENIAQEIIVFKRQFREQTLSMPYNILARILKSPVLIMILKHFEDRIGNYGSYLEVGVYESQIKLIIKEKCPELLTSFQMFIENLRREFLEKQLGSGGVIRIGSTTCSDERSQNLESLLYQTENNVQQTAEYIVRKWKDFTPEQTIKAQDSVYRIQETLEDAYRRAFNPGSNYKLKKEVKV